jgi:hypothetical protein
VETPLSESPVVGLESIEGDCEKASEGGPEKVVRSVSWDLWIRQSAEVFVLTKKENEETAASALEREELSCQIPTKD